MSVPSAELAWMPPALLKAAAASPARMQPAPTPFAPSRQRRHNPPRSCAPPRIHCREDRGERSSFDRPRGPEFKQSERRDAGAAKRPYTRKPAGEFGGKPAGDFAERPKRSYTPKQVSGFEHKAGGFDRKPGSFARKPAGDSARRQGGFTKRESGLDGAEKKRGGATGGFGFSQFSQA